MVRENKHKKGKEMKDDNMSEQFQDRRCRRGN